MRCEHMNPPAVEPKAFIDLCISGNLLEVRGFHLARFSGFDIGNPEPVLSFRAVRRFGETFAGFAVTFASRLRARRGARP